MNWLNPLALATGLALTVAFPFGTAQAQSAVTKRSTELRESPADNAPSLGSIPANTQLTRTNERNGPWVKVQTPEGASGWVHNFDMGAANSAAPSGNNNASTGSMRTLGGALGRGGSSTTTPTATAGTRGWGNGKANQAPAGASQDGDDEDHGGDEAPASTGKQQPARPGYSAGNQATPYQRMPSTTPQQAMPPGMSTYSSGNQNWGNGGGGTANGWGAPSK